MAKKTLTKKALSKDNRPANIILMQNACKVGDLIVVNQLIELDADLVNPGYAQQPFRINSCRAFFIRNINHTLQNLLVHTHIIDLFLHCRQADVKKSGLLVWKAELFYYIPTGFLYQRFNPERDRRFSGSARFHCKRASARSAEEAQRKDVEYGKGRPA
jgi:hypothetical protein